MHFFSHKGKRCKLCQCYGHFTYRCLLKNPFSIILITDAFSYDSFPEESSPRDRIRLDKDKCSWMGGFLIVWASVNYHRGLHLIFFLPFLRKKEWEEGICEKGKKARGTKYFHMCVSPQYIFELLLFIVPALCQLTVSCFCFYIIEKCALSLSFAIFSVVCSWMDVSTCIMQFDTLVDSNKLVGHFWFINFVITAPSAH